MSFSDRLGALLAVALTLLVAACGELPRPFRPDDKSVENPLLVLNDRGGIVVMPLAGAENDDESHGFAEAMADALRKVDVPAHTGAGNRASLILSSFLERGPQGASTLVLWLNEPGGNDIGHYEAGVDRRVLFTATPRRAQVLRTIALAVAAKINPGAAVAMTAPPVFIAPIRGSPGNSGAQLQRALDAALRRSRVDVAGAPGTRALTVAGTIRFADRPKDMVALDVAWRVLGTDGAELGNLSQQNEIPARVLERAWPDIANAIAENAAGGIAEIVGRAPRVARR